MEASPSALTRSIKIQLVVYHQCCVLIGWATTRLLTRLCSKENFREPFGLPSILAKAPRPQSWSPEQKFQGALRAPKHSTWGAQGSKLVARVHLTRKYFVRTLILLACWSPNSLILAFGCDKNPHVVLWNPSKIFKTRNEQCPRIVQVFIKREK